MFLSTVVKYFGLSLEITRMSIRSAMEYRLSFMMQVIGMMLNNMAFIIIWTIYFDRFGSINGWTQYENLVLQGVVGASFGVAMIFAGGSREIAKKIASGGLDYYLSLPKNPLWHILVSKTFIYAIGDFLFGLLMFILAGNLDLNRVLIFAVVTIFSAVVFNSFLILTQSLAFWFGDFEAAAQTLFETIMALSLYPQTIFQGVLKFITMFLVPAFFMAFLPVDLVINFGWDRLAYLVMFSLFIGGFSVFVFNQGLKRYESGNLIGVQG